MLLRGLNELTLEFDGMDVIVYKTMNVYCFDKFLAVQLWTMCEDLCCVIWSIVNHSCA